MEPLEYASCTFLEKSATSAENNFLLAHFFKKVQLV
jgi:hypothetical protein